MTNYVYTSSNSGVNKQYTVDGATIKIINRSVLISDDGKSEYSLYIQALNGSSTITNASPYPIKITRCNPYVAWTNSPNCPTSTTQILLVGESVSQILQR